MSHMTKKRNTIKKITLLLLAAWFSGCGPSMTLLVHPVTGHVINCRAGLNQYGAPVAQNLREDCVNQHSLLGYVEAAKLTPAQRLAITPRQGAPVLIEQRNEESSREHSATLIQMEMERQRGEAKGMTIKTVPRADLPADISTACFLKNRPRGQTRNECLSQYGYNEGERHDP